METEADQLESPKGLSLKGDLERRQNAGALGEGVRNRGWKSPKSGSKTSGVQSESDEWKSLTNRPRPRVAWRKESRRTCGSTGSNDRREAYSGKSVPEHENRLRATHEATPRPPSGHLIANR
jgi:hypothetical protein